VLAIETRDSRNAANEPSGLAARAYENGAAAKDIKVDAVHIHLERSMNPIASSG
jgi:hypothetical protein